MTTSQASPAPAPAPPSPPPAVTPPAPEPPAARRGPRLRGLKPRRRALSAPGRLRVQALAMLVVIAALCAVVVTAAVSVRDDAAALHQVVAGRAAAAADLRFALADLDAQRANSLVPGHSADRPATLPPGRSAEEYEAGNRVLALLTAQQRRTQASDLLRRLAADPAEGPRVRALLDGLGRYDDLSGRSAHVDEQTADRLAGRPPATAVTLSVEAGQVMHAELLPGAAALGADYQRRAAELEHRTAEAAARAAAVVGAVGAVAVGVLVFCQYRLARRYGRVFNPPLLAATLAVAAITAAGPWALLSTADEARTAGRDGLRPWSRLAEARAVAAEAAAAESRWFVRDAAAGSLESTRFAALTGRLDTLLAPAGSTGRAAHRELLTRYGHFREDDRNLRRLRSAGRLEEATVVLTEVGRGRVAFDFWDFATRLDTEAGGHMATFTTEAGRARGELSGWPAVPATALGAAGVLVVAGVRVRLAEYR
ncbi:hypothetical protein M1P56_19575 [Streptomyces sp. HU2014]|uniref:hypothetical protein n=1 Tax=Streptomyces sp. HU2014 TaxID=2939414 RepID=UPI00200CAEFB|nr:hypothetical protein [Streptomyces sp. HU2014]UQI46390.1 hypothetical protein M1P56_19575 [Streptomyces sp. HU2014]